MNLLGKFLRAVCATALLSPALAQVATDQNEGSRVIVNPDGTYTMSWWGKAGRTYFIQYSENLIDWTYVPIIQTGSDAVIQWGFSSTAIRFFLKLKFDPSNPVTSDTDGDGLSDSYEVNHGLDPFSAADALDDSDGDGVPNIFEYKHGWDPFVAGRVADPNNPVSTPPSDFIVDGTLSSDNPPAHQYKTLTNAVAALNALTDAQGDYSVIDVKQGTVYSENEISIYKCVLLLGEAGSSPVQLASSTDHTIIDLYRPSVVSGFWIHRTSNYSGGYSYLVYLAPYGNASSQQRLENCIISGNWLWGNLGASIYLAGSSATLVNCTLFNNHSTGTANNISGYGLLNVTNSIIWNSFKQNSLPEIVLNNNATSVEVHSSIIRDDTVFGSWTDDPKLTPDGMLTSRSSAINRGSTFRYAPKDIQGESRPAGGAVDLGADEFVDTDSDNLPDIWEIDQFTNLTSQAGSGDYDGDRLLNRYEYELGFNPKAAKTDPNGLGDLYEALTSTTLSWFPDEWLVDSDGDGLTDGWEVYYLTNPNLEDSNGDGVLDGASVQAGIDPAAQDNDGDGISNSVEIAQGTSPFLKDTDGDGVFDRFDAFPLDPTRSTAPSGSASDTTKPDIFLDQPIGAILQ